jgi:hypothetical protein
MLKREGVHYLFGIPGGGGTIDLLDAAPPSSMPFASCDGRDFNE